MRLHLPNSAWINNIDSFITSLDTSNPKSLNITSHKDWVSVHPAILCMVASLGMTVRANKGSIDFPIMTATSKHYFERMNLFNFLELDSEMKIKKHDESGRFIPLTQIKDSNSLNRFITDMIPLLHKNPEQVAPIRYIMSELIRNVIEHSNSPHGALVCAQHYPKSNKIRIGVVDTGIGIKKSINNSYPEAQTNLEAIKLALTPGITGTTRKIGGTEQNAGAGLFIIKSIAKLNRDFFLIYSGDAMYKLLCDNTNRNERLNRNPFDDKNKVTQSLPNWRGTVVAIDLSLNKEINFTELFILIGQAYKKGKKEGNKLKYKKPIFTNGK